MEKSFAAAVKQNGMTLLDKVTGVLTSQFPTANKEETKRLIRMSVSMTERMYMNAVGPIRSRRRPAVFQSSSAVIF